MPSNRWTEEEIAVLVEHHGVKEAEEIAEMLPGRSAQNIYDAIYKSRPVRAALFGEDTYKASEDARVKASIEEGKDGPVSRVLANRPRSAEEMAEIFGIDTEAWKPKKIITNQWGKNWQTKIWWELNIAGALASQKWEELLDTLRDRSIEYEPQDRTSTGVLYEILILDAHLGQLSWAPEAGENWDLALAVNEFRRAFLHLLNRCPGNAEKILVVLGNDLFAFDSLLNKSGGLTQRGTVQDVDGRWQKLFVAVKRAVIECLEEAAERADVEVLVVPGNHDYQTCFYLGELLDAYFHADQRVQFDVRPSPRKYYRWGSNLLGFTHGDEEPLKELPGLMANEAPNDWSKSEHREWHTGDKHHVYVDEQSGVVVRIFPSLAPKSAWATRKGYLAERGARAIVWSREPGWEFEVAYNPPFIPGVRQQATSPLLGDK